MPSIQSGDAIRLKSRKLSTYVHPSGVERKFRPDEVIVSKTDAKGVITYTNRTFMKISDFGETELLGAPHSILRHPDMPRCIFKLLWDTLSAGKEIFAYVVNLTKTGDHYWVLAHVTPSKSVGGDLLGYHSNRRVPDRRILEDTIIPLYRSLLAEEQKHQDRKTGLERSHQVLLDLLKDKGVGYDELVFSL